MKKRSQRLAGVSFAAGIAVTLFLCGLLTWFLCGTLWILLLHRLLELHIVFAIVNSGLKP
ncbi:MAG: hypothetical protein GX548_09585 [Lentisphaerae bacterium]|nr:hypothetical protein [Lentisphaerota bacterium]